MALTPRQELNFKTLRQREMFNPPFSVYIAASFRHKHGVRLLGSKLRAMKCHILDWTDKATPPPDLTPLERRVWMDTDREGGQVYSFCKNACLTADMLIYYGTSGQDAGVEIGLAAATGLPVLGIRGPLEAPGLMLHGAVTHWVNEVEEALNVIGGVMRHAAQSLKTLDTEHDAAVRCLCAKLKRFNK
ncbi:MAG: translation initiation factor 2 [Desulfovibrio sp.]|jgi:hypothetical protein|nr:translation initiation factor 2 [Desulfovibrio sp.]